MKNTEQRFEEFKNKVLARAKEAEVSTTICRDVYNTINFYELCGVIKSNFWWCCINNVLIPSLIDEYSVELEEYDIYHNKSVSRGYVLVSEEKCIEVFGTATVVATESSIVVGYESTDIYAVNASVTAYQLSTVKAFGTSVVDAYHRVSVVAKGEVSVTAHDMCYVISYGMNEIKAHDQSIVRYNMETSCELHDDAIGLQMDERQ